MKQKIILFILGFFLLFGTSFASSCKFEPGDAFDTAIESCLENTDLVKDGAEIEGNLKTTIKDWTQVIAFYLAIAAVLGIVYGGLLMTISGGEDEKITKAKGVIKWSIIGFLALIFAATIVTLVVNLMYGIG